MKKGFINIEILVGYFVVLIIYLVGFYPIMREIIASVTGADELTAFVLSLIPLVFLLAIIIGIMTFARGEKPIGAWGGE